MEFQRQSFGWKCSNRCIALVGFPGGTSGKEPAYQCRRHKRWVWSLGWEDPLEEEMAPTLVSLPRESPWTEELSVLLPWGHRVWSGLACTQIALPDKGGHSSFLPLKTCVPTWEDLMRSLIAIKLFNRRFLRMAQTVKCLCLQCGRPRFYPWVRKILCRRIWQPTPVFLPGKSDGQRSVVGNIPWGHKESDMTEQLHFTLIATVQGWGCWED